MHERTIEIRTADGRMETFITHPEQGGPFAPVDFAEAACLGRRLFRAVSDPHASPSPARWPGEDAVRLNRVSQNR